MFGMTAFGWLATLWGVVTALLTAAVIFRSIEGMHEENQIFLNPSDRAFEAQQRTVAAHLGQLNWFVKTLTAAEVALLAAMLAWVSTSIVRNLS